MELPLLELLLVALGGAAGGVARFWLSGFVARRVGETFPWGTLLVNVSGSAAIGGLAAWLVPVGSSPASPALWAGLVTGMLGSYTTVSSFGLQTMSLMRSGEWMKAAANVVASVALCLSATMLAYAGTSLVLGS